MRADRLVTVVQPHDTQTDADLHLNSEDRERATKSASQLLGEKKAVKRRKTLSAESDAASGSSNVAAIPVNVWATGKKRKIGGTNGEASAVSGDVDMINSGMQTNTTADTAYLQLNMHKVIVLLRNRRIVDFMRMRLNASAAHVVQIILDLVSPFTDHCQDESAEISSRSYMDDVRV